MTPRPPHNPICVALDGRDAAWIRDVANSTHPGELVARKPVFLDLKFHDIPAQIVALRAGADVLVIGRPITAASDPGGAAAAILESLT